MNSKNYSVYVKQVKRQPVFIDGPIFVRLILMYSYDRRMFDNFFRNGERYYVPDFSYEKALKDALTSEQRKIVLETFDKIPAEFYEIFDTNLAHNSMLKKLAESDEEAAFAECAMKFLKEHDTSTMRVSSPRVWDLIRIATVQKIREDLDLL